MKYLRDYQQDAKNAVLSELSNGMQSTLLVMPTGTGKTETALAIIDEWPQGSVLGLAHREELIWQPWHRWREKTGQYAEMEMAEYRRSTTQGRSRLTFASKDSLWRENRLKAAFPDPQEVGLIWVDEAHHAIRQNKTYQRILDYFSANRDLRIVGTTATPDRTDEQALGQTFGSVAYDYPLLDPAGGPSAISDGWLVPIRQEYVIVEELDFDDVGTRGGDFIDAQLEREMIKESPLHKITSSTANLAGDQKTLVFTAGVNQAARMAEIFNRYRDGNAFCICSRIDPDNHHDFVITSKDKGERRRLLRRYEGGEFQFLVNVAVFTEGTDEPTIVCISMARPTKSRSLYCQMLGRGTRVLQGVIEGDGWRLDTAAERKIAILNSAKPTMLALDFVGNSRHALISTADILGGKYRDEVVERAKRNTKSRGGDVQQALTDAEEELKREVAARRKLQAKAAYRTKTIDPFATLAVVPSREPGWHKGRKPTAKQKAALAKFRIEQTTVDQMSFWQATKMLDNLIQRAKEGQATYRQCKVLARFGEDVDVSFEEASEKIDAIARNKWRPL